MITAIDKQYELYINDTQSTLNFNQLSFNIKSLDKLPSIVDFSFGFKYDNLNECPSNIMYGLKANRFYDDDGRIYKKTDYSSDGILYEVDNNGNKVQCIDLRSIVLEDINSINNELHIRCDWYVLNPDSYTANMICKLQDESKLMYQSQMSQYNQLKQQLEKDLDIDPNESVFSNNFRKSFNKIDWFKPYKI